MGQHRWLSDHHHHHHDDDHHDDDHEEASIPNFGRGKFTVIGFKLPRPSSVWSGHSCELFCKSGNPVAWLSHALFDKQAYSFHHGRLTGRHVNLSIYWFQTASREFCLPPESRSPQKT